MHLVTPKPKRSVHANLACQVGSKIVVWPEIKHNLELIGEGHKKVTKCTQLKVSTVAKILEVKPVYRISIYEGLHGIIFDQISDSNPYSGVELRP